MDPAQFGYSTLPLQHAPYDTIAPETMKSANTGKVAFVTGAGQGIGAAISEALAKSGAHVAIIDLRIENLAKTKEICLSNGVNVADFACDVTDADKVKQVMDMVEHKLGPIDILVNNAGIFDQRPFMMSTFDSFWRQIEVNFKAPLMLIHQMLPRMKARGSGCIINIASRSGTVDVPMTLGYVTSKAALIRATHTLQLEMELDGLDPAIHLYALHPGGVRSSMGGGKSVGVVICPELMGFQLVLRKMSRRSMATSLTKSSSRTCSRILRPCAVRLVRIWRLDVQRSYVASS
jgi:NAD(P)-dependent dehydrogenase (short-subunit alcohol dehydrogenase family)